MSVTERHVVAGLKTTAVAAAFVVGLLAARLLPYWAAYHTRPAGWAEGAAVCRATVDHVSGDGGQAQAKVTITSGPYSGQRLRATHAPQSAHEHDAVRVGEGWLVDVRSLDGRLTAHLCRASATATWPPCRPPWQPFSPCARPGAGMPRVAQPPSAVHATCGTAALGCAWTCGGGGCWYGAQRAGDGTPRRHVLRWQNII